MIRHLLINVLFLALGFATGYVCIDPASAPPIVRAICFLTALTLFLFVAAINMAQINLGKTRYRDVEKPYP